MLQWAALALLPFVPPMPVGAQETPVAPQSTTAAAQTQDTTAAPQTTTVEAQSSAPAPVTCASTPEQRTQCAADTSKGIVLLRSTGNAPCLLGKTWGYDQTSVWVSDGCSADFSTGIIEVE